MPYQPARQPSMNARPRSTRENNVRRVQSDWRGPDLARHRRAELAAKDPREHDTGAHDSYPNHKQAARQFSHTIPSSFDVLGGLQLSLALAQGATSVEPA